MEKLFFTIVWIAIIVSIFKKIVKKNRSFRESMGQAVNSASGAAPVTRMPINVPQTSGYSTTKKASNLKNPDSVQIKDDREHDWLHRQLIEEHQAYRRTSAMFNLKYEHAASCDARKVAQYHRENCDAHGVDNAEA